MTDLTQPERDLLLAPCECGHSINDHGALTPCWECAEDNVTCEFDFEALLCARVGVMVAARVATAAPVLFGGASEQGVAS